MRDFTVNSSVECELQLPLMCDYTGVDLGFLKQWDCYNVSEVCAIFLGHTHLFIITVHVLINEPLKLDY